MITDINIFQLQTKIVLLEKIYLVIHVPGCNCATKAHWFFFFKKVHRCSHLWCKQFPGSWKLVVLSSFLLQVLLSLSFRSCLIEAYSYNPPLAEDLTQGNYGVGIKEIYRGSYVWVTRILWLFPSIFSLLLILIFLVIKSRLCIFVFFSDYFI